MEVIAVCDAMNGRSNLEKEGLLSLNTSNGSRRKFCYQTCSRKLNGPLGNGNRRRLPKCIEYGVRKEYPKYDANGTPFAPDDEKKWMGFKKY